MNDSVSRLLQLMIEAGAVLHRLRNLHVGRQLHDARRLSGGDRRRRERIGIAGIGDDEPSEAARQRVQHVGDHHGTAAIVEHADARARTRSSSCSPGAYASETRGAKLLLS